MKSAGQHEQDGYGDWPKSRILHMMVRRFLCNVNDKRDLIGLCLLVTLHLGQIRDPWHSQAFTKADIVIGLSLHTGIHIFYSSKVYYTMEWID